MIRFDQYLQGFTCCLQQPRLIAHWLDFWIFAFLIDPDEHDRPGAFAVNVGEDEDGGNFHFRAKGTAILPGLPALATGIRSGWCCP